MKCQSENTFGNYCWFYPLILEFFEVDLNLDMFTDAKRGFSQKVNNRKANSVDPDEMAHYEPSHQDLYCFQKVVLVCRAERVKYLNC